MSTGNTFTRFNRIVAGAAILTSSAFFTACGGQTQTGKNEVMTPADNSATGSGNSAMRDSSQGNASSGGDNQATGSANAASR